MPTHSPPSLASCCTTGRFAAFKPGQSPPPVSKPTFIVSSPPREGRHQPRALLRCPRTSSRVRRPRQHGPSLLRDYHAARNEATRVFGFSPRRPGGRKTGDMGRIDTGHQGGIDIGRLSMCAPGMSLFCRSWCAGPHEADGFGKVPFGSRPYQKRVLNHLARFREGEPPGEPRPCRARAEPRPPRTQKAI